VSDTIVRQLRDPHWVSGLLVTPVDGHALDKVIATARDLSAVIAKDDDQGFEPHVFGSASGNGNVADIGIGVGALSGPSARSNVRTLIEKVVLTMGRIVITLDGNMLSKALLLGGNQTTADAKNQQSSIESTGSTNLERRPNLSLNTGPIEIWIDAHLLRCGRQVRLVLGQVDVEPRAPDTEMIRLLSDAARWFDDLLYRRVRTLAEIAARENLQISHVSRTIGLAFLAPDIVSMILSGTQPSHLTIDRLRARREPLPVEWPEQRRFLLISPAHG
jgi:hypothetical protein